MANVTSHIRAHWKVTYQEKIVKIVITLLLFLHQCTFTHGISQGKTVNLTEMSALISKKSVLTPFAMGISGSNTLECFGLFDEELKETFQSEK